MSTTVFPCYTLGDNYELGCLHKLFKKEEKCCGNKSRRQVSPQFFRVLRNFQGETGRICLLLPLENTTRKELLFISNYCYSLTDGNSILYATVITLSCILFVLLVVIGELCRRAKQHLKSRQGVSPRDQQMSEPGSCMELSPRALERQSPGPLEC